MCETEDKSYEAEILLSRGYEAMARAHRARAVALKGTGAKSMFEKRAEACFDEAEALICEAFNVNAVNVARYAIDGSKLWCVVDLCLDEALKIRHVLSTTSAKLWVPLSVMSRLDMIIVKCKEALRYE